MVSALVSSKLFTSVCSGGWTVHWLSWGLSVSTGVPIPYHRAFSPWPPSCCLSFSAHLVLSGTAVFYPHCDWTTSGCLRYSYFLISSHQSSQISSNSPFSRWCQTTAVWNIRIQKMVSFPVQLPIQQNQPWNPPTDCKAPVNCGLVSPVARTVRTPFRFAVSVHFLLSVRWLFLFSGSLPTEFSPLFQYHKVWVLPSLWCEYIHKSYFKSCYPHILACCIFTLTQFKQLGNFPSGLHFCLIK